MLPSSICSLSRRRLLAATAVALPLAGVVQPRRSHAQATPTLGTPIAPPDASAFPVTITHGLGETTVEAPPSRIVLTAETEGLDSLLALGLSPVLTVFLGGYIGDFAPWASAAGAESLTMIRQDRAAELDIESIAAATPDLILASWIDEATYELLSSIAPTIVIKNDDATTWQDIQLQVGEATGYLAAAEAIVAETEAQIATELTRLDDYAGLPVAIAYFWFDQFLVNGDTAPIGRVLAASAVEVISPDPNAEGGITILSLEQIDSVRDARVIIAPDFLVDQTAAQEANELFRALPAVRDGGYMVLSPAMAQALYLESALGMQWAIPQLVDAVIAGAHGEGRRLD